MYTVDVLPAESLFLQLLINHGDLAAAPNHTNIPGIGFQALGKHCFVMDMPSGDDDEVRSFVYGEVLQHIFERVLMDFCCLGKFFRIGELRPVVEHGEVVAPTLRCSTCGAALVLDENPDSFFAFLQRG